MRMRGHSATTWPYDQRYEPFFRRFGVLPFVLQFKRHSSKVNHSAITAHVDRWRPETHSFHLACGEMTMRLQDMAMISGLHINGRALTGTVSSANWRARVAQYIGVMPNPRPPGKPESSKVTHIWLQTDRGGGCPHLEDPMEEAIVVEQYARAYLWYLLTKVVFPYCTGNSALWMFLDPLDDWDVLYSWGSAALSFLYRQVIQI